MQGYKKILVIRLSSIGDIAWTSPVFRLLRTQQPQAEIHFCTKREFRFLVQHNPNIDKIHYFDGDINKLIRELKAENIDVVIDLHNNIRSNLIKFSLFKPFYTYSKRNFQRFLFTKFQWNTFPSGDHIVKRYLEPLKHLGVYDDGKGLEFYFGENDRVSMDLFPSTFVPFVIGASKLNKKLSFTKTIELLLSIKEPIVLIGGPTDAAMAQRLLEHPAVAEKKIINTCGKYTIAQSAYIVSKGSYVVGHDTGLTHIAAAFDKKIYSIWGATSPQSFEPFRAKNVLIENKNLSCRPCCKAGLNHCPKKHFKCIEELDFSSITFEK